MTLHISETHIRQGLPAGYEFLESFNQYVNMIMDSQHEEQVILMKRGRNRFALCTSLRVKLLMAVLLCCVPAHGATKRDPYLPLATSQPVVAPEQVVFKGTIEFSTGLTIAVIEVHGKTHFVREHQRILDGRVIAIFSDELILVRGGKTVTLQRAR